MTMQYRDGTTGWHIHFGAEADGDVIAMLMLDCQLFTATGIPVVVDGGTSEFHTYEIAYDPDSATASLLVDGVSVHSGWGGCPFAVDPGVFWGAGTTEAEGSAAYSAVQFSIVTPVPAMPGMGVFLLGLLFLAGGCVLLLKRPRTN